MGAVNYKDFKGAKAIGGQMMITATAIKCAITKGMTPQTTVDSLTSENRRLTVKTFMPMGWGNILDSIIITTKMLNQSHGGHADFDRHYRVGMYCSYLEVKYAG